MTTITINNTIITATAINAIYSFTINIATNYQSPYLVAPKYLIIIMTYLLCITYLPGCLIIFTYSLLLLPIMLFLLLVVLL